MSKMSNIAMELDERAVELGFADHLEAMANGYDWGVGEDCVAFLWKAEDEQEKAHEAWLKRKERTLKELRDLQEILETLADGEPHKVSSYWADTIWGAINFIEEGEM